MVPDAVERAARAVQAARRRIRAERFSCCWPPAWCWLGPAFFDSRFVVRDGRVGRARRCWRGWSTSGACRRRSTSRVRRIVARAARRSRFGRSVRLTLVERIDGNDLATHDPGRRAASAEPEAADDAIDGRAARCRSRGRYDDSPEPRGARRRSATPTSGIRARCGMAERWARAPLAQTIVDLSRISTKRSASRSTWCEASRSKWNGGRGAGAARAASFESLREHQGRRRIPRHLLDGERAARQAGHAAVRDREEPDRSGS